MCTGRISSTSGTGRISIVYNTIVGYELVKDMITTEGIYPWSFVTQIFRNGSASHSGDHKTFELINSI